MTISRRKKLISFKIPTFNLPVVDNCCLKTISRIGHSVCQPKCSCKQHENISKINYCHSHQIPLNDSRMSVRALTRANNLQNGLNIYESSTLTHEVQGPLKPPFWRTSTIAQLPARARIIMGYLSHLSFKSANSLSKMAALCGRSGLWRCGFQASLVVNVRLCSYLNTCFSQFYF